MHRDLETLMPTFVIESIFVVVESLVKNQYKGKFLKLYILACLIVFFQFARFWVYLHAFARVAGSMATSLVVGWMHGKVDQFWSNTIHFSTT